MGSETTAGRDGRFIAGDPLRAIAAISVLLFHLTLPVMLAGGRRADPDPFGPLDGAVRSLQLGVYVFFVLSGYLLSRPFVRAFHRGEPLPAAGRYVRNRLLRIVPAFWVVTAVVLLRFGAPGSTWTEVLAVPLFAQTLDESRFSDLMVQAWTLGAELFFYLLLPLGAAVLLASAGRMRPGRRRAAVVVAVVGAVAAAALHQRVLGAARFDERPVAPVMLFAFAPGIALAAVEVLWGGRLAGARHGPAVALALLAAGVAALGAHAGLQHAQVTGRVLLGTLGCTLVVAAPLVAQWTRGTAWRALDNRLLHWLGERSYGIYLVHNAVIVEVAWVYRADRPSWATALLAAALVVPATLLASALLHRCVERPFLALRSRTARRPTGTAAGSPAPRAAASAP